ncbi:hypothetical protein E4198_02250 [Streptomyces sp. RKND-216]|uniref:hypothetical protein n=1 Tax=Streptomyces sp. RKND-216 TaxID=2562581 RepID=UPI00109DBF71|nr:hypothetical protein [Streptomyces sp. RKND-216]THA23709.1 hypothetical protein E4198_02250 [Streptomyces sp. RKND-216]
MEQRPESPEPAVLSAGTDPTHIPGLPGPATAAAERQQSPDASVAEAEPATDGGPDDEPQAQEPPRTGDSPGAALDEAEADDEAGDEAEADGETADADEPAERDPHDDEEPPEGPAFEVRDHRGAILADGRGVVFRLDDTEARFRWSDIGSVEIGASRFAKRFEVAVGTRDPHRRFDAEVIAPTRKTLQQWTEDLDAVLDAWFDDDPK